MLLVLSWTSSLDFGTYRICAKASLKRLCWLEDYTVVGVFICQHPLRVAYALVSLPLDLPEPLLPGLEIIKLVSMLNSAEHEIYPAHKC